MNMARRSPPVETTIGYSHKTQTEKHLIAPHLHKSLLSNRQIPRTGTTIKHAYTARTMNMARRTPPVKTTMIGIVMAYLAQRFHIEYSRTKRPVTLSRFSRPQN